MAKEKIITLEQKKILDLVSEEDYLARKFYFTGGTALSEFYLKHRLSEGLDFFSEQEIHLPSIERFIGKAKKKLNLIKIDYKKFLGLHSFYLFFDKKNFLKVDFNYYPFPRIEKGIKYKNIVVDSLYDIAVNKVHTISMKARVRDFIDIYFIIKEKGYSFEKLLIDAKIKFDWHIDSIQLGSQLVEAVEVKDYPRMIKRIKDEEWQNFFLNEAKKLKKKIFK
ncbi:nucleotidyl transferase AbiEii/AbiGii toxin family protein [Patescibacteria group bacterium]|nr:nucleotidyl transferase AbiEii/AbiGii toxin family protein [Patescibacteria group bacterium]